MNAFQKAQIETLVRKIVSGGQTGVDRGALDVAMALEVEHGGWCPLGRLAEDGVIPARYQLQEHPSQQYARRTEQNVIDSDGTLLLHVGPRTGGTEFTYRMTKKHGRPCLCVDLSQGIDAEAFQTWLKVHTIDVLNVAGPRESSRPGIQEETYQLLWNLVQVK